MTRFTITQGDLLPALAATLQNADGTPINLTGAIVTLYMDTQDGTSKIAGAAVTVTDATNGKVQYAWAGTDTDTAGTFRAEFRLNFSGANLTVPNDSYIAVEIKVKLT